MNCDVLSPTFAADNPDFDPAADILGTGRLAFLVPDAPFGINLQPAGYIHDHRWDAATTLEDYHRSNNEFYDNVFALAEKQGLDYAEATVLAEFYFQGVNSRLAEMIFRSELKKRGIDL